MAKGQTCAAVLLLIGVFLSAPALPQKAGPDHVDITWMSISNMFYEIGSVGIVTDGYITRIPKSAFYGAPGHNTTGPGKTLTPILWGAA